MIAFVAAAAAEAASGKSILEQAALAPVSVSIAVFLISLGSVFPKFAAGVPLATLTDATGDQCMQPCNLARLIDAGMRCGKLSVNDASVCHLVQAGEACQRNLHFSIRHMRFGWAGVKACLYVGFCMLSSLWFLTGQLSSAVS